MDPKPYREAEPSIHQVQEPSVLYGAELHLDPAKHYTYADYLTWTDNKMRELLNGVIRIMSAPYIIHAKITGAMFGRMWPFIKKRKGKCKVFHAPVDVRLPKNSETADDKIYTVVQPDICVVCDPSKIDEKGIIGAPDLVVEVQSPSTARYVLSQKYDAYEEAGVKEYWVVYPKAGVTVFLLQDNGKYDAGTTYDVVYMPDAKIPVRTVEGLEIGLKELFED
jgi:Uma2 family endonuclease